MIETSVMARFTDRLGKGIRDAPRGALHVIITGYDYSNIVASTIYRAPTLQ